MPFPQLTISSTPVAGSRLPGRADVALFVGLVGRRTTPLPDPIRASLVAAGWAGAGPFARSAAAVEALLDVPVAVSSWSEFDSLFAWNARPLTEGGRSVLPCALGAAVRSFFAQGGVKAWIVRTGDPLPLLAALPPDDLAAERKRLLCGDGPFVVGNDHPVAALVPGADPATGRPVPTQPESWTGCAHIWGIDDVAMLLLPDLPELLAGAPQVLEAAPVVSPIPEQFKPCDDALGGAEDAAPASVPFIKVKAPRLGMDGYLRWASIIRHVLDLLAAPTGAAHRRDVMLIASLPLPDIEGGQCPGGSEVWPFAVLDTLNTPPKPASGAAAPPFRLTDPDRLGSARLQLAYPWIATDTAATMPEAIEGGEGALAGLLAQSALRLGGFRSAAGQSLAGVRRLVPALTSAAVRRAALDGRADWLGDRIALFDSKPSGIMLLSDSTMAASREWRSGGVSRLAGIILRAARWLGQDLMFEPSGPDLWASIRADFEGFLTELLRLGALAGATPRDAFEVRCDSTTMSQADIDAGRLIVEISFTAAHPIERISVSLALSADGAPQMQAAA